MLFLNKNSENTVCLPSMSGTEDTKRQHSMVVPEPGRPSGGLTTSLTGCGTLTEILNRWALS